MSAITEAAILWWEDFNVGGKVLFFVPVCLFSLVSVFMNLLLKKERQ